MVSKWFVLLLFVPALLPGVQAVDVAGLSWSEVVVDVGTFVRLDSASNGEISAVLYRDTDTLFMALVDDEGNVEKKTVVDGSDTLLGGRISFVTGQKWLVVYWESTTTTLWSAFTEDDGDSWDVNFITGSGFSGFSDTAGYLILRSETEWNVGAYDAALFFTEDSGQSWANAGACTSGNGAVVERVADGTFRSWATKNGPPRQEDFWYLESSSCPTFSVQTFSSCPPHSSHNAVLVNTGVILTRTTTGSTSTDGMCFWDGAPEAGSIVWTEKSSGSSAYICTCGDGPQAATGGLDAGGQGIFWVATSDWTDLGYESGALSPLGVTGVSSITIANGKFFLASIIDGDVHVWVSSLIPVPVGRNEAAEFEVGFEGFISNLGFKSAESQFFFGLILLALVIAATSFMVRLVWNEAGGGWLITGAALAVLLFNLAFLPWQFWHVFTLITIGTAVFAQSYGKVLFNFPTPSLRRRRVPEAAGESPDKDGQDDGGPGAPGRVSMDLDEASDESGAEAVVDDAGGEVAEVTGEGSESDSTRQEPSADKSEGSSASASSDEGA